jgi:hypothetical protein
MQSALIISLSDFSNRRMDMDSSQITQLRREIAAFSFSIPSDQDRADHWGDLGAGSACVGFHPPPQQTRC